MGASGRGADPLPYGPERRRAGQHEDTSPKGVPHGRRSGKKAFMLYLPPELHTAIQMRKAVIGEDMGDIMVGILTEAMVEELAVVRELTKH